MSRKSSRRSTFVRCPAQSWQKVSASGERSRTGSKAQVLRRVLVKKDLTLYVDRGIEPDADARPILLQIESARRAELEAIAIQEGKSLEYVILQTIEI